MISKEAPALVAESLVNILPCAYENTRIGVCSVIYNFVEPVLLDLLRRDVIDETLNRNSSTSLNSDNAAGKTARKLFTANSLPVPFDMIFKCRTGRTGEAIALECTDTKMK